MLVKRNTQTKHLVHLLLIILLCAFVVTSVSAARDKGSRRDKGGKQQQEKRTGRQYSGRDNSSHSNRPGNSHQGLGFYRPDSRKSDYRPSSRVPEYRPKDYRPPTYQRGRYYYPSSYNNRPQHYGYWVPKYNPYFARKSLYFYFGYFPYMQICRAHTGTYISIGYRSAPICINLEYYQSKNRNSNLDQAMSDIRAAWTQSRSDLMRNHVSSVREIAVLLDGKYDYSINSDDYIAMTSDAIEEIQTVSFTWDSVRQRTDGTYTAFGKHIFRDSSGDIKTIYVSYTLRSIVSKYVISEVDSSTHPLD